MYRLFGHSPVKPLQTHMEKVVVCVQELVPFFEAVNRGDHTEAKNLQKHISKLEKDADKLNSGFQEMSGGRCPRPLRSTVTISE